MTADILREKFLSFFKSRHHKIVDSDSLVPKDDPTVLFTPAGMNQFKKEFMGFDAGFKRAATSQRCLRTDDLEKVGKTSAHHTFFEMLGNFSFGNYFKPDAINWAWEFLIKELKIDPDKLWVSVYQDDDEAYNIWKDKIGIPEKKIVRLGDKDNFWPAEAKEKGPNGPCGPCSEIFYDFGPDIGCGEKVCDPSCSCGRFVEIWNLVFTQFNRKDGGVLEPLPAKNIDTGMGLERLTAVMQGRQNNFETELFQPIIREIQREVENIPADNKKLLYAIADHLRAAVFSIYDGISPSNEGRGYIVRKIIRKAAMHLRTLGISKPFLNRLVGVLAQVMQQPYPELKERQEDIALVIRNEEVNFIETLGQSGPLLDKAMDPLKNLFENQPKEKGYILATDELSAALGNIAFKLYDSNGIPAEIVEAELNKKKIKLSESFQAAYQEDLEKQKNLSKSSSKMKGDVFDAKGLGLKLEATKFCGYKENTAHALVLAVLKEGKAVDLGASGDSVELVLDQTPFYAESGGQAGDAGRIENGKNVFQVTDTQKIGNVFLHRGKITAGSFKKDDKVSALIDVARRQKIAQNHTATHILQAALREILGKHVRQQGSLVNAEKLRFDFTHFKALSKEEITRVEELANSYVYGDSPVHAREMPFKEAKKAGALAFFEEKYGENVRMVEISNVSKELCGGTHLERIKDIGLIKITSESSVASGIRRIEAVTAEAAQDFIQVQEKKEAEELARKNKVEELKAQEKKRFLDAQKLLPEKSRELAQNALDLKGIKGIFSVLNDLDVGALRLLVDMLKENSAQTVVALGVNVEGKAALVVAVTSDLCKKGLSAKSIIGQCAPLIGGSGGGRDDFAQAGGSKPENFTLAFDKIKDIILGL